MLHIYMKKRIIKSLLLNHIILDKSKYEFLSTGEK